MEIAKIKVNATTGRCVHCEQIPAGIVGATVSVQFCDPVWDRLSKTVIFRGSCSKIAEFDGQTAVIPWEVLEQPGHRLCFGIWGSDPDSDFQLPLIEVDLGEIEAATEPGADPGTDPTLPIWAQLKQDVEKLKQGGAGGSGAPGEDGEDGGYYTPGVTQIDDNIIQFNFTPSQENMPAVNPETVELPAGQGSGGKALLKVTLNLITKTSSHTVAEIKEAVDAGRSVVAVLSYMVYQLDTLDAAADLAKFTRMYSDDESITVNCVEIRGNAYTLYARKVNDNSGGNVDQSGGLSATASALLISILRSVHIYEGDQSANITALEAALASGDSGGTDEPDTPVEPGVTYYTIVNVLTNVTNSNSTAKVSESASYIGKLTAADGFNMSTVTVTMGGVDVTADVYADGTITIESVTGNVIITASAVEDSATAAAFELTSPLVLGDTTDPRINDTANCRIATGETVNDDEDWTICVDFTSLAVAAVDKAQIFTNENKQVKFEYSPPNWNQAVHGYGASCNDFQKIDGVFSYGGKNSVLIATWTSTNKTYQAYGTAEYTKTFESIATASDGQLYIGNAYDIGTINRFALYKRVLSADEITEWIGG